VAATIPERLVRVAVGLGDTEREHRLLPALTQTHELVVLHRALAADDLLDRARAGGVDLLLVAADLHRLNDERQRELLAAGIPLVVLAAPVDQPRWRQAGALVVDVEASPAEVRQAVMTALDGTALIGAEPEAGLPGAEQVGQRVEDALAAGERAAVPATVAVASAPGSPGRSTVALNLAASLGR
jgi:hypothetical protein